MSGWEWAGVVGLVLALSIGATMAAVMIGGGVMRKAADAREAAKRQPRVDVDYTRACAETMRRHPTSRLPGTHQVTFDQPWEPRRD